MELKTIDPQILMNQEIAEKAIMQLIKVKEELDDFLDNLEMLSDKKFKKNMDIALEEYKKGEVIQGSINDLRKQLNEKI